MSAPRATGRWRTGCIGLAAALASALLAVACGGGPTAPTLSGAVLESSISPAPGSTIYIGLGSNANPPYRFSSSLLQMTFTVKSPTAADKADLQIELFDATGQRCANMLTNAQVVAADVPVTFTNSGLDFLWMCTTFVDTDKMRVTLITEPPHGSGLPRTPLFAQVLPGGFSFRGFPPDPPGGPASPPVLSMGWADNVPGCGGTCFGPLDGFGVYCGAVEGDGAPTTVTLTISWDGGEALPRSTSIAFPTGATAAPLRSIQVGVPAFNIAGAVVVTGATVPQYAKGTTVHATAVCTAVNSRGQATTKTLGVPY